MPFPERRIVLTGSSPTLQIGRASNRLALGLQSETANAWFDSPVMSRNHARISADIANKVCRTFSQQARCLRPSTNMTAGCVHRGHEIYAWDLPQRRKGQPHRTAAFDPRGQASIWHACLSQRADFPACRGASWLRISRGVSY